MTKSLLFATSIFVLLGIYYTQAEEDVTLSERVASVVEDPVQAARSAALGGITIAKQGLIEEWRSGMFAGRYRGAKYNAAVTVRDQRARVESIGRAVGAGGMVESYRLRVDVYRSPRADLSRKEDGPAEYSYRIRPVATG
ncbi:MAG: hypothetical protein HKN13_06140 [Rhodothermales bacterium]|nr:hypothetical protein [Rhodothermales bacterium]